MGMLRGGRDGDGDGIDGDLHLRGAAVPHPTIVVTVDDIEATLALVVANGGEQLTPIEPLTDTSRWCYVRDSEGNAIGLHDRRPAA
jgi:predicted enzyme related to lactoylglutathione lyase